MNGRATPPPRDEWARELAQAHDDAAIDVAEAFDEAREVAEAFDEAREVAERGGVEPWREAAIRSWSRAEAERQYARTETPRPDGWIVRMRDTGRAVAAGPIAREALALACELGHGEGRQAWPATVAELDSLDLPPSALGIAPGAPRGGARRRTATTSGAPLRRASGRRPVPARAQPLPRRTWRDSRSTCRASRPATGNVSEAMLAAVAKAVAAKGIRIIEVDEGDWHAGRIRRAGDGYAVRVNRNHARETRFATIAHELAHLHLGHLGANPKHKPRIPDRGAVRKEVQEVEAESVAFVVCRRRGVRPASASYLAQFIRAGEPVHETLDVERVMTAAGTVEAAMFPWARDSKRRKPMIWQDTGDTT